MSSHEHQSSLEEAISWHVRLSAASAEDWTAFMLWLEASPHNRDAYDQLALADAELDQVIRLMPANDPAEMPRRQFGRQFSRQFNKPAIALVATAAVALLAVVFSPLDSVTRHSTYAVETAAGQRQSLALADGTRVELNGGTRLLLDRQNTRYAQLERGEAMFDVHHDAAQPFVVNSGSAVLRDVGTVFNVAREGHRLDVAVVEGAVLYNPSKAALMLRAGSTLAARDGDPAVKLGQTDPQSMAGWRNGRLTYQEARLADIAADVTRTTGLHLTTSPDLAGRVFTGVILVDHNGPRLIQRLEALLDVDARQVAGGWQLVARSRAAN